jgi:hypothetical protein
MCGAVGVAPAHGAAPVGVRVAVIGIATADAPAPAAAMAAAVARGLSGAGAEAIGDGIERAAAAVAAGAVPAARLEGFRRVQEMAAEGWRRYLEVAPDVAAVRLGQARLEAEALLGLDGGRELYADISLRLGVVLFAQGRGEEAARVFRLARALDPERAVGMTDFAPDAVAAFERAVAAPEAARRAVHLAVTPPGAAIEVDGVAIGEATAGGREVELAPGQHVVAARAAGFESRGLGFAVDAGRPGAGRLRIELALDRDAEAALLSERSGDRAGWILGPGTRPDDAARALGAVLRYGEVEAVVLVAAVWQREVPVLLGQRCAILSGRSDVGCGAIVEVAVAQPEELERAAAELARRLADEPAGQGAASLPADPRLAGGESRPGSRTPGGRCRLCRNRWVWLGAAAATILVGGTAIWALGDSDPETLVGVDPTDW